ncbi:MAG TPA: EamA family transporter [Gemmatimonadaceae bacterium]|nr:EamA family transporter [Gemmatimonadaceae bacterium]
MISTESGADAPGRVHRARPGVSLTDAMLVTMAAIWGINISVVKIGTQMLEPLAYNSIRVALAAVSLLIIGALGSRPWPAPRQVWTLLGLGVIGNGLYQVFFIEGIARTRAGSAALVLAATPAFIALIGRARGVERISSRGMLGIAISVGGIGLVVYGGVAHPADAGTLLGNLLVLAGSLCWAVFTVLLLPHTHQVDGIKLSALTLTGGAIPLLLLGAPAIAATAWSRVPALAWGAILFSGIGALVIAYLFYYRGVRLLGPTRTAMYGNLQPIIALFVAWLTLGETPTIWQGLGAGSIMTGLLMTRM